MAELFFKGYENENRYRNYPFSETSSMEDGNGIVLPSDVFIDAIVYAVNVKGVVRMSRLDFAERVVEISDDSGMIGIGKLELGKGRVQLYDSLQGSDYFGCQRTTGYGYAVGVIVCGPGFDRELSTGVVHEYGEKSAVFAPSAVCPIAYSGVTSIDVRGEIETRLICLKKHTPESVFLKNKVLGLFGDGRLVARTVVEDKKTYLWFDVLQNYSSTKGLDIYVDKDDQTYKKDKKVGLSKLVIAVPCESPFRVSDIGNADYLVTLGTADREDVCYQANKGAVAAKAKIDTCPPEEEPALDCSPEGGSDLPGSVCVEHVASGVNDVGLLTPDLANYKNPVWIGVSGDSTSHTDYPKITNNMSQDAAIEEVQKLHKIPVKSGGSLEVAIPGFLK